MIVAAADRSPLLVIVNCKFGLSPEFPSDTDGSSTVNPPSSSMIVPTPVSSERITPTGELRLTVNVSLTSASTSPFTTTVTVVVSESIAKIAVPPEMAT